MSNFHEEFKDHYIAPDLSNRAFGLTSGTILSVIGLIKGFILGGWLAAGIFISMGSLLIAVGFFYPVYLEKFKVVFLKIAPVVARVVNPLLMGFIFAICFIPAGFILKAMKRDPLHRTYNPYAPTYWTKRDKHGLPDPMKYQF